MKRIPILAMAGLSAAGFLMAQGYVSVGGNHWQRYWGWPTNAPPPLALPDAYSVALAHVGPATNRFFCVAASTLEMTNYHFRGWTFTFSDTNGQRARVEISFDKESRADLKSERTLRQQ